MKIAILPARLSSKRIPRKNIKKINGKPIIYWTIKKLIKSKLFDHIIVSTDSSKISDIAIKSGASVPFLRSKKLSDDFTTTIDVIKNSIHKLNKINIDPDYICCVYHCSIFLDIADIKKTLNLCIKNKNRFVYPIIKHSHPINRALLTNKKNITRFLNENTKPNSRTQDFPNTYYDSGQFYWGGKDTWIKRQFLHEKSIGYEIENHKTIDIDNKNDWIKAEFLFKKLY